MKYVVLFSNVANGFEICDHKGAELVIRHLSHFFVYNEHKLVSEGESQNIKFKIVRESNDAKNLIEGECILISLCYFIAKIEDEMKTG